jgi:hypothetical protein
MRIPYKDPAHTKVSWLMDNSPPAFPDESSGRIKTVLSNYSYGIAGDFHPTSFEILQNKNNTNE